MHQLREWGPDGGASWLIAHSGGVVAYWKELGLVADRKAQELWFSEQHNSQN